ncbi:hypothetical protein [Pseudomonas sp. PLMAX]|uniref:hypothetical protein n=1 Tax=Pseudomonas sp. PLMAX TaxID=2201998 RepID=UPI0038BB3E06
MYPNIGRIMEGTSLSLGVIKQRYGGYTSIFLAPSMEDLKFVDEELNGGDTEAVEMQSHLGSNAGTRFPHGSGDTFEQAMAQLESLAETLQPEELQAWGSEVRKAFAALREAEATGRNCPWWLSKAFREGRLTAVN